MMRSLASRVDRIVNRMLISLPPGNLTFERAYTPGLITYTLRVEHVEAGTIEIKIVTVPSPGVLMTYTVIENSFFIIQNDEEFFLEIPNMYAVIREAIELEIGEQRWKQISSVPNVSKGVREVDQIFGESALFPDRRRQPWEKIPNRLWDRTAVELWCMGYTNQKIAKRVNVHPRSVANRLSALRKRYPQAGIPLDVQRKTYAEK